MSKKSTLPPFDCSLLMELSAVDSLVAGVDEVGRGALFGPVVAAAVVFPRSVLPHLAQVIVKDSKQLSSSQRVKLVEVIKQLASSYYIGQASAKDIDQINILQATLIAMRRAILGLNVEPKICLIDGKQIIPNLHIPQISLVSGDTRSPVIAAASILAKVWRDDLLVNTYAVQYPDYDLAANKGYGTEKHRLAISQHGVSPQHRMSFRPCRILEDASGKH